MKSLILVFFSFLVSCSPPVFASFFIPSGSITRPKLAAVGQQISSSTGSLTTNATSFTAMSNLTLTITTSGRPVMLMMIPDGTTGSTVSGVAEINGFTCYIAWFRGATQLGQSLVQTTTPSGTVYLPPGVFSYLDTPTAGTYTYVIKAKCSSSSASLVFQFVKITAYEL